MKALQYTGATLFIVLNSFVTINAAHAEESATARITQQLHKIDASIQISSVEESAFPGLYEVMLSRGTMLYTDPSGQFLLQGTLYRADNTGLTNLSEKRLNIYRHELLATVNEADMIRFRPEGKVKARVAVFTDVDCPYCRKLHKEVPKLNAMGIEVDYLAFPRGGEHSAAFTKMQSLWCAEPEQRQAGMNQLKDGKDIEPLACDSPVMSQFELGRKAGVTGTPALLMPDGRLIPGYMQAERLAALLDINTQ